MTQVFEAGRINVTVDGNQQIRQVADTDDDEQSAVVRADFFKNNTKMSYVKNIETNECKAESM